MSRLAANPRLRRTLEKFVDRLTARLETMEACVEARDFAQLAELAHWLKGAAGTVGFDAFTGPAEILERHARQGTEAELEPSLARLRRLAERIVVEGRPGAASRQSLK